MMSTRNSFESKNRICRFS